MKKVRLSKEFKFETAHVLENYDGLCSNLHGHSYKLIVTVIGTPIDDINNVKYGMVLDFSDLKKIVNTNIVHVFDHALVLRNDSRFKGLESKHTRIIYKDYQPTAENMLLDFAEIISPLLPDNVELHSMLLRETASSYAEWFASDQK